MSAGVRVTAVGPGGVAERVGLRAGDRLLAINGHAVADQIDVQFRASASRLRLRWRRGRRIHEKGTRLRPGEFFGWELESFPPRRCNNRCPFCFVLQLPPGLRSPLYFRDEDFRLSFLYGHYITGTNLTERDLDRIVGQRLSPLYISVHATDPVLRAKMLGRRTLPPISRLLDFLAANDIAFHTQIVVCPDWNDGPALMQTLEDLRGYYPALQSVAVVPVGLTCHRDHLPHIRRVTPHYAARLIGSMRPVMQRWRRSLGERVLFLADEWFLRARRPVPAYRGIDVAPQFENGVGMVADFMRPWTRVQRRLPNAIAPRRSVAVVTGVSAATFLRPIVRRLNAIEGLRVSLVVVRNRLFGPTVTVSGLLAGRDVSDVLLARRRADRYLLPANCLRPWDHLFLDDVSLDGLATALDRPVRQITGNCSDFVKAILSKRC